ncbi:hypothetical protein I5080_13970 [Salmonella enterica]|nr:hypothetical protein I5080_13970 [Salmonella enterica]
MIEFAGKTMTKPALCRLCADGYANIAACLNALLSGYGAALRSSRFVTSILKTSLLYEKIQVITTALTISVVIVAILAAIALSRPDYAIPILHSE